jgi:hypothetical protein
VKRPGGQAQVAPIAGEGGARIEIAAPAGEPSRSYGPFPPPPAGVS